MSFTSNCPRVRKQTGLDLSLGSDGRISRSAFTLTARLFTVVPHVQSFRHGASHCAAHVAAQMRTCRPQRRPRAALAPLTCRSCATRIRAADSPMLYASWAEFTRIWSNFDSPICSAQPRPSWPKSDQIRPNVATFDGSAPNVGQDLPQFGETRPNSVRLEAKPARPGQIWPKSGQICQIGLIGPYFLKLGSNSTELDQNSAQHGRIGRRDVNSARAARGWHLGGMCAASGGRNI